LDGKLKNSQGFQHLAKIFKVSPIVAARRALDMDLITSDLFFSFWRNEKKDWEENKDIKMGNKQGGSPYRNFRVKLGKTFSEAVLSATRSGFLSYRDAFRLTGLHGGTFDKYMSMLKGGELD
jgi:Zn-dependent peptidase ImmA (M78 family)